LQARYSAIYQVIIALAFSAGAVVGAAILSTQSYQGVFLASSIGRFIAALVFVLVLRFTTFERGVK
jgi:predicted MFS family arabinose efflux permease